MDNEAKNNDEKMNDDQSYDKDHMTHSDGISLEDDMDNNDDNDEIHDSTDSEETVDDVARTLGEHKSLSDESAKRDAEMLLLISEMPPSYQSDASSIMKVKEKGACKGKGRGLAKKMKVTEPMYLEFDHLLRPTGKWRLKYGQHVGFCLRKLNINWEWSNVSKRLKQELWKDTMRLFHIADDPKLRKNFLSALATRFRNFKSKLVSGWITCKTKRTKYELYEPPQIWKYIKWKDWNTFKKIKTSPEAEAKRAKAMESAKHHQHFHRMGQMNYEDSRAIWIKEGFYPACTGGSSSASNSSVTVDVNRGDDWYCAMHKRDKETGKRVIDQTKTKEVADKYLEFREKQSKGEFVPERNKDALYMALGEKPDHRGRAYGFGGINVGYRKAFGKPTPKPRQPVSSGISTQEREKIKNELREELRQEFNASLKEHLSSLLQGMGVTGLNLPDGTQFPPAIAQGNNSP